MQSAYLSNAPLSAVLYALTPVNRAVCRVTLETGLRVSDVLALPSAVLKNKSRRFTVTEQKTGKKKACYLSEDLYTELCTICGKKYIFEHRNDPNKHRTRQTVWKDLKRAERFFRLRENVSPHTMRKCYAVDMFKKYKGDIKKVQAALNHDYTATTVIYALADVLQKGYK